MQLTLPGYTNGFLQLNNKTVAGDVTTGKGGIRRVLLVGNWPNQHSLICIV